MIEIDKYDDLSKRVPITFRVPVKKKQELLKCAKNCGASLTDVLEVLTEDPEEKLNYDLKELIFEITITSERLNTKEDELKNLQIELTNMKEELNESKKESLENAIKSLKVRRELLDLKEKYGEINSIPQKYKMVAI